MDKKRLEYYKKKLVARREELMKTIARTEEEGRQADDDPTVDLADKAANSYTKEFLFGMTRPANTVSARTARKSCSRRGSKRCRGPSTALTARKKWSKASCNIPPKKSVENSRSLKRAFTSSSGE
jgi:hypothetical protein